MANHPTRQGAMSEGDCNHNGAPYMKERDGLNSKEQARREMPLRGSLSGIQSLSLTATPYTEISRALFSARQQKCTVMMHSITVHDQRDRLGGVGSASATKKNDGLPSVVQIDVMWQVHVIRAFIASRGSKS